MVSFECNMKSKHRAEHINKSYYSVVEKNHRSQDKQADRTIKPEGLYKYVYKYV